MFRLITFTTFLFSFLVFHFCSAQTNVDGNPELKDLKSCLEQYYNTNDLLVNGSKNIRLNSEIKGHPYFLENEFISGAVFIRGQNFKSLSLKYNSLNDELVLRKKSNNGSSNEISLNDELIDSFLIGSHLFINKRVLLKKAEDDGYLEQLYKGKKYFFFKKHQKLFRAEYNVDTPQGFYRESPRSLFVYKGKAFYKISSKRGFLTFFEKRKEKIIKYMRQNNVNFKKATDDQLYKLFKYVDEL